VAVPPLQVGAELVSVEGPLASYDEVARILTVSGVPIVVPTGLLIDTDADTIGDVSLSAILNPLPGFPAALGGTVIADATAQVDLTGCATFVADVVYFELGEHVIVGPLVTSDPGAGTFNVAGSTVVMNTDPRFPSNLMDLGGNPLTIAELAGWEGTVVGAEGHFYDGVLHAKVVETEVIPVGGTIDTVVIERADLRLSKGQIEVRGVVQAALSGAFSTFVQVDVGCNGTVDNTAAVVIDAVLTQGSFRYRSGNNAFRTNPGNVCVTTELGATAIRDINAF
jgi:hypothetical protein